MQGKRKFKQSKLADDGLNQMMSMRTTKHGKQESSESSESFHRPKATPIRPNDKKTYTARKRVMFDEEKF